MLRHAIACLVGAARAASVLAAEPNPSGDDAATLMCERGKLLLSNRCTQLS